MFQKGLSTATESAVTLSTMREMMYFTKTKRSYFRFAPPPTPEKSLTEPLQSTPHTRAQMAGLVPVVARGIVAGLILIAPCINDSLAQSEAPFPWLGQGVCTSFKLFFSALTEREIGKFPRLGKNWIILP